MNTKHAIIAGIASLGIALAGCDSELSGNETAHETATHGHPHPAGTTHGHEETPLGSAQIGDLTVEFAQGHGVVGPGKEMHLVVKLPYSDNGASVVRAWIGTEDRMQSRVAKGEYAASHDDYDVHAEAPDPLPEGATWWVEIEQPDGAKHVGSCRIL